MKKSFKIYVEVRIEYAKRYGSAYTGLNIADDTMEIFKQVYESKAYDTLEEAEADVAKMFESNWFDKGSKVTILPIYEQK